MLLKNCGITMEATDPAEINRLKRAGYVEVKDEAVDADANTEKPKAVKEPKGAKKGDGETPPKEGEE